MTTLSKAAGAAAAENILPGVTETDTCKKIGAQVGYLGNAVGAVIGGGGAIVGTGLTAVPTLGTSVAASPWTTAAGVVAGGMLGGEIGSRLGEAVCSMGRAAVSKMNTENKAQIAHKPDGKMAASSKAPDPVPSQPSVPSQGRS